MPNRCNVILGAGAVKAAGQVGAIKAILDNGWEIANICGVSAGSIPAVLTAFGYPMDSLIDYALNQNFYNYRTFNRSNILGGVYRLDKLGNDIENKISNLNRQINLHIVTCSILSGKPVCFKNPAKENISKIIQASCAIPALFKPIEYNGDYLVDGGVWQTSPILYFEKTKYRHLPTFVISCNTKPNKCDKNIVKSPLKLISRAFALVQSSYVGYMQETIQGSKNIYFISYSNDIDLWELNPSLEKRKRAIRAYQKHTEDLLKEFK